MIDLDVIIPAYNAKSTIEQTLASLASQTEARHLKVFIANDCSDYDYSSWVSRYQPAFKSLIEIRGEKNGGPGYIRQYVMDRTSSEYIMFIDADDTLGDSYSLYHLMNAIRTNPSLDIVHGCGIEERCSIYYPSNINDKLVEQPGECLHLHGKIYKRSFIYKYNIRFYETMTHEDICFNVIAFSLASHIGKIEQSVFNHHYNGNSITRSPIVELGEPHHANDKANKNVFENYKKVKNHIFKYNNNEYTYTACTNILWEFTTIYLKHDIYCDLDEQRAAWFTNECKIFYDEIIKPIFDTPYALELKQEIEKRDNPLDLRWNYLYGGKQCKLTFAEFTDMLDNYKIEE